MKETVTKFDLEAAFKALDEIDMPSETVRVKANRPPLTEIFSKKSKFDALMEEYYEVSDTSALADAKENREAEIAKAKLARIEKIVDLDAESPEDLLTSYVGKYIIQCPQCMTLFYKNKEDVVEAEDDASIVNINEVCQHCGNDSGYTLVGKVGEVEEEPVEDETELEMVADETGEDGLEDVEAEETATEADGDVADAENESAEDLNTELGELNLEDVEDEEKKEEAFSPNNNSSALVEGLLEEADLEVSDDEFSELLKSTEFETPISDAEVRNILNGDTDSEKVAESCRESTTVTEGIFDYEEDYLTDKIDDILYYGKFLRASHTKDTPTIDRLDTGIYRIRHWKDNNSFVVVQFDMTDKSSSTVTVDVDGERFTSIYTSEIQDFILNKLKNAYAKKFDINLYESTNSAAAEDNDTLEEGVFDKLKSVLDKVTTALKSREAKANWILQNAQEDYDEVEIDPNAGKLEPSEQYSRFKVFLVVGFKDTYVNGKPIKQAPSFSAYADLVPGMKNVVEVTDKYENADKIAKGWSMKQGNGPAFIYMGKDENDSKAVFLCEYFKGELVESFDQLDKYFEVVKKDLAGSKLMAKGGANESLEHTMTLVDDVDEAAVNNIITESLINTYSNVANFKLTECAYDNECLRIGGTVLFTSGRSRNITYVFESATSVTDNKVTLTGLNEKLGTDRKFDMVCSLNTENKTLIAESIKRN